MPRRRQRLPDVPRLLELKGRVREVVAETDTASSVSAFIAWKALLMVSRVHEGDREADQLESLVTELLKTHANDLRSSVSSFVGALTRLSAADVSPGLRSEWLRSPQAESDEIDAVLRHIKNLQRRLSECTDDQLWLLGADIALNLRRIRHVVIGHAQVSTGTPLFAAIVGPFEGLVTRIVSIQFEVINR